MVLAVICVSTVLYCLHALAGLVLYCPLGGTGCLEQCDLVKCVDSIVSSCLTCLCWLSRLIQEQFRCLFASQFHGWTPRLGLLHFPIPLSRSALGAL